MRTLARWSGMVAAMAVVGLGAPPLAAQVSGGTITVDDQGQFVPSGQAMISGTYTCEEGSGFAFITGNLVQPVGRLAPIRGDFITEAVCTGETETSMRWCREPASTGGRAVASASLMVCPDETCVSVVETTEEVSLRR